MLSLIPYIFHIVFVLLFLYLFDSLLLSNDSSIELEKELKDLCKKQHELNSLKLKKLIKEILLEAK